MVTAWRAALKHFFPEAGERLLDLRRFDVGQRNPDPMLELLAADTAAVAEKTEAQRVAPPKSIFAFATSAGAFGAVLLWLILAGPGYFGYGASLLWAGLPKAGTANFRYIGGVRSRQNKLER